MKWDVNNYNLFLNNVFLKNKFSTTNHLTTVQVSNENDWKIKKMYIILVRIKRI